jgi:hypothetical protein
MMDIIVQETADGNCMSCPKCVQRHKFLELEEKRLCKFWGIDMIKFGKEVERQEKHLLKKNKENKDR